MPSLVGSANPSRPGSQHGSQPGSQPASQRPSPRASPPQETAHTPPKSAPPSVPYLRRSTRESKPTQCKLDGMASKSLAAHSSIPDLVTDNSSPTLHSSSTHYHPSFAPLDEPHTLRQAMDSPYSLEWTGAIHEELASIDNHGTFTIILRPSSSQSKSHWIQVCLQTQNLRNSHSPLQSTLRRQRIHPSCTSRL